MLFSGITFLYYFLPIVLILYTISPKKFKNSTLLAASLVFYAWGEPRYVLIMLAVILCAWLLALVIEKTRSRLWLGVSVALSLSALCVFKYADFFIENFAALTGLSIPLLNLTLPIGISFYTFQIISYSIDVYRGNVPAQRDPFKLATYVALFPQLIAGPIVRYTDVHAELESRTHTLDAIHEGIRRFILGLGKKVLLANVLGELCASFTQSADKSVAFYWLYAFAYMLQIYFDFSGYSDMAIGLGRMLGFKFPENFNYPFISRSVTEFWRRWHMTLGGWFRDYVYIPMGGNRVKLMRWLFNILTVWLLTGFWHGAEWNFIIWGLYFAVFLLLEKLILKPILEKSRIFSHVYLIIVTAFSFAIFAGNAGANLAGMLGIGAPAVSAEFFYFFKSYAVVLLIAAIGATPLPKKLVANRKFSAYLEPLWLAIVLVLSTAFLVDGSFNPFLYFRF